MSSPFPLSEFSLASRRHMLRQMLEIRACEERIQELFVENVIRGTTHLCIGQEAVSVGMAAALDAARGDTVTCTYRGHGDALALGMPLNTMMAEMMGKEAIWHLDAPIRRVTMGEAIVPFSAPLEAHVTPNAERVIAAVKSVLHR